MVPAYERLEAGNAISVERHQRLVVQLELIGRERVPQVEFERAACLHACVDLRLEEAEGASPFLLGPVERHVGSTPTWA